MLQKGLQTLMVAALFLGLGSLALCLFTDQNDTLFLPLALASLLAGNLLNHLLRSREAALPPEEPTPSPKEESN